MSASREAKPSKVIRRMPTLSKWWTYQRERFPAIMNGLLILAFSSSAVSFSTLLRHGTAPTLQSLIVAFLTSFTFFLQLRISDEFKDFEEDSQYRPYRPVPRGLVTLRELGWVFAIGALIQLSLALWHQPRQILLLLITWLYLAGMSKEFFMRRWLKSQPLIYMVSHMAIMPLIDLYATACDWSKYVEIPPSGLLWFLVTSFFNGMVIEIGRKIRVPADEENGVQTYTFLWGRVRAIGSWWLVLALTLSAALGAARNIQSTLLVGAMMSALFIGAILLGVSFLRNPVGGRGKMIEMYSGIWTLFLYLSLGVISLVTKMLS